MIKKEFLLHKESGLYVSKDGEVFVPKTKNHPEHYTYGGDNGRGYRIVCYKGKKYRVHRLVAEVYLPNHDNKPCIDHINTNRSDNRVENLRWCTHLENSNNPLTKHKQTVAKKGKPKSEETRKKMSESKKGKKHPMYGKHPSEETIQKRVEKIKKPIIGVNKKTGVTVEFESATDAAIALNIYATSITACCRGIRKSTGGYVWQYA